MCLLREILNPVMEYLWFVPAYSNICSLNNIEIKLESILGIDKPFWQFFYFCKIIQNRVLSFECCESGEPKCHLGFIKVGRANPEGANMTVQRELVEPHGAHEGDVAELVVEQLLLLDNPQTSQSLQTDQGCEGHEIVDEYVGHPEISEEFDIKGQKFIIGYTVLELNILMVFTALSFTSVSSLVSFHFIPK